MFSLNLNPAAFIFIIDCFSGIILASNVVITPFQVQIFINPKSFITSLDFSRGVGFIEKVFFFEIGRDIYI